jgi:hypothetical protein
MVPRFGGARLRSKLFIVIAFIAVVALSAILVAGCGKKAQDPQESLASATQSARDAGSVKALINVNLTPQEGSSGSDVNIQGDASLDMNAKVMEANLNVLGFNLILRYVNGTAYVKFSNTWYELSGELMPGIGKDSIGGVVNLLAGYPDLLTNVKVGDYDCINYDVTPDYAALAANTSIQQLLSQLGMSGDIESTLKQAGFEMQVAIQKSEPILREVHIVANADMPQGGKIMGLPLLPDKAHIEAQIDFPDYGVEVKVDVPQGAKPFTGIGDLFKS